MKTFCAALALVAFALAAPVPAQDAAAVAYAGPGYFVGGTRVGNSAVGGFSVPQGSGVDTYSPLGSGAAAIAPQTTFILAFLFAVVAASPLPQGFQANGGPIGEAVGRLTNSGGLAGASSPAAGNSKAGGVVQSTPSQTGGAVEGLSNTLGVDGAGTASTNGAAAGLISPFEQAGGYVNKEGYAGASLNSPLGGGSLQGHL